MKSIGQLFVGLLAAASSALIVLAAASLALLEGGASALPAVPATATITAAPALFTASPMPLRDISPSPTLAFTATATPTEAFHCPNTPKDWVQYTVQDGDTLDSLAARARMTTDAYMQANCIPTGFQLSPGWLVYLPPNLPTLTPTVTETPTPTETPTTVPTRCIPSPPPGWITYIVRPKDTLFMLSRYYNVSVGDLMQANCLSTYQINVNQRLYVPNRPTMTPVITNTPVVPTETPAPSTETPVPATETPTEKPTITTTPTQTHTPTLTPSVTPTTPVPPTETATQSPANTNTPGPLIAPPTPTAAPPVGHNIDRKNILSS